MRAAAPKVKMIDFAIARPPPPFYDDASPEDISEALEIGAHLLQSVRSMRASQEVAELEQKKAAEIAKIKQSYEDQLKELTESIDKTQREQQQRYAQLLESQNAQEALARKEGGEQAQRALAQRLASLEQELAILRERNAALTERKTVLEAGRDQDVRIAEERTRALLQHALDEKERSIQRYEKSLEQFRDMYDRQTEEIRALRETLQRKALANVKVKGTEYEAIFRDKLVATYGMGENFSLVDSARNGIGHAGDYLMTWGQHTVLWEVKNYDRPVPSSEVDKFKRDMKENAHIQIGVIVSRYTPITGKTSRGDRDIEFIEGKMLIYLSNFEAMSDDALGNLMLLFRLWWESDKQIEESESREAIVRNIEKLHATAVKSKIELRLHKSRMEETVRWMSELVEEHEQKLQHTLNILQGSRVYAVPEGVFRDCAGDEKSAQLIQLILQHTQCDPHGSLVLAELADLVGKHRGLGRDTARAHIRAVLLDSAIEPAKGKNPMRVRGLVFAAATVSDDSEA